jgi:hypothetical protein
MQVGPGSAVPCPEHRGHGGGARPMERHEHRGWCRSGRSARAATSRSTVSWATARSAVGSDRSVELARGTCALATRARRTWLMRRLVATVRNHAPGVLRTMAGTHRQQQPLAGFLDDVLRFRPVVGSSFHRRQQSHAETQIRGLERIVRSWGPRRRGGLHGLSDRERQLRGRRPMRGRHGGHGGAPRHVTRDRRRWGHGAHASQVSRAPDRSPGSSDRELVSGGRRSWWQRHGVWPRPGNRDRRVAVDGGGWWDCARPAAARRECQEARHVFAPRSVPPMTGIFGRPPAPMHRETVVDSPVL